MRIQKDNQFAELQDAFELYRNETQIDINSKEI